MGTNTIDPETNNAKQGFAAKVDAAGIKADAAATKLEEKLSEVAEKGAHKLDEAVNALHGKRQKVLHDAKAFAVKVEHRVQEETNKMKNRLNRH
jgi:hypothetical protein